MKQTGFSEEEATQLAATFQGWITGMLPGSRLGSAALESFPPVQSSAWITLTAAPNCQQFFAWVLKDIFRDNQAIYDFLKQTSLLDQLAPTFCDALLRTSNAATILECAERQGLFVLRTSEAEQLIYRCHPILREVLREELRRQEPEKYRDLHYQIATLFFQQHANDLALDHALEAQQYELAARILLENVSTFVYYEQSEAVLCFLDRFPAPFTLAHPRLLLLRVTFFLRQGDFATARLLLASLPGLAAEPEPAVKDREEVLIHIEFALACGRLLLAQGAYQEAHRSFLQVLALIPMDEHVLRITAYQQLGLCLILGGEPLHEGIAHFQRALLLCHPQRDERLAAELHLQLANASIWAGNYAIAEHHHQRIRAIQDHLRQPQSITNNLIGMGILRMHQGRVEEAETCFQAVARRVHQPHLLSSKAYALLGLGELAWSRECWHEAFTYLEEALSLARQLEDRYLLTSVLHTFAMAYLRNGEAHTAQYLLDQVVLHSEETRSYESILHQLTQGTILLNQQGYEEAQALFEEVVHLTERRELPWLRMQALMRLAACYLAQGQHGQTHALLHQVRVLNSNGMYDYCVQEELHAYPRLRLLLQEPLEQAKQPHIHSVSQEHLQILALGEPVITIAGTPITHWRMARAMELCFYLLDRQRPLRKDDIIAALWSEDDESEHTNQTFRSTIYYVRQVLGEACLVHRSGLYRLDLGAVYGPFRYDVAVFEEQQQLAKTALAEEDDERAARAFQQMVDLYRGGYVQAFYSDWCIGRRDALRQTLMEARRQLALIAWRREEWNESLLHWQHLLTLDPCLETAHYGVMRCYVRQGKRDLALRQYQHCSRELREQLNVKPGPTLQKLYRRLASGEV